MKTKKIKKSTPNKSNDVNYNMYKICFSYNPFDQNWYGCEAEHLNDLWNGVKNPNIYHNPDQKVLIKFFNQGKHLK